MIKIKKGLNIPISGSPEDKIIDSKEPRSVGLVGADYHGMKPAMLVKEGERVKIGQPLFKDKKNSGVLFTSPGGGVVESINRGARRVLQSIVIGLDPQEDEVSFESIKTNDISDKTPEFIREHLISAGLWTSLRTRPYSKIPTIKSSPSSIFVNCMDTNPLSADPEVAILENEDAFLFGIEVLKLLSPNPIHICVEGNSSIKIIEGNHIYKHTFAGPHPSGLVGTHMHFISPASLSNINWYIDYSDVISFGLFFKEGRVPTTKYISLSGPQVNNPRIISTRIGAGTDEICSGELKQADNRVVSGSVINGREAIGPYAYLGKYHNQVSVVEEPNSSDREMFDWALIGRNRFSKLGLFISALNKNKKFDIKARMYGPDRSILPVGVYEQVFPFNILVTLLLRSIAIGDTEELQALGGLELDEEDLALCSFVCPAKHDFGSLLRHSLTKIEVEG